MRTSGAEGIRPLAADDLDALTTIRRACFRHSHHASQASLRAYLAEVFLDYPPGPGTPSLVYEDGTGAVIGFLGALPRELAWGSARDGSATVRAAVLSHFMVHPDARGRGVGLALMRAFLDGSQDLSYSDVANDATRAVWRAAGGDVVIPLSLYWRRALRPARHAAHELVSGPVGRAAYLAVRPALALADALLTRPGCAHSVPDPPGRVDPLSPEEIPVLLEQLAGTRALRPRYSPTLLTWLLGHLRRRAPRLELGLVRDASGEPAGWFVYVGGQGSAAVVQLVARPDATALTWGHLARHAFERGVVSLEGRLDAALLTEIPAMRAAITRDGPWVLAHSRRAELREAVHGDPLFTRLDGEWWMCA